MIGKFNYLVGEGFRNLWRARLAAIASILAITVATSFIVFSAEIGMNFTRVIDDVRSRYELQVFFLPLATDTEADQIVSQIRNLPGVKSATLITKQQAAEIFEKEFGENIFELLQENPLPPSCVVKLAHNTSQMLNVEPVLRAIKAFEQVEEVRYSGYLISTIERYYQGFLTWVSLLTIGVLLGTIILISNTIRLTIYARRDLIHLLRLIGATHRFIKFPFLVEGIVEGILGSLLASGVAYGFIRLSNYFLSLFSEYQIIWNFQIVFLIMGMVTLFSLIGSLRAVRKFLV